MFCRELLYACFVLESQIAPPRTSNMLQHSTRRDLCRFFVLNRNPSLQEPRPPERFLEMHRLAYIVKAIDRAVAVVPKGALLVEVNNTPRFVLPREEQAQRSHGTVAVGGMIVLILTFCTEYWFGA